MDTYYFCNILWLLWDIYYHSNRDINHSYILLLYICYYFVISTIVSIITIVIVMIIVIFTVSYVSYYHDYSYHCDIV